MISIIRSCSLLILIIRIKLINTSIHVGYENVHLKEDHQIRDIILGTSVSKFLLLSGHHFIRGCN